MADFSSQSTITTSNNNPGEPFQWVSLDEMTAIEQGGLCFGDIIPDSGDEDELDLWNVQEIETAFENALLKKMMGLPGYIDYRSKVFNKFYK